jgi:cell division GTPase FtsZ
VYKILEKVLGCNDVGIYTKKFSDHSLKNRQTQKADNKRIIKKLSADSDTVLVIVDWVMRK